jgi:single-strand DNA-binding protein
MINKVTLVGNIGQDPEIRVLDNGTKVARLTLATNENYKDKSGEWQKLTEWHNIVVWREAAEAVEKYYKKGMLCYVEGKITYRKWQDKEGKDRYTTEIVSSLIKLLEKRENTGGSYSSSSSPSTMSESMPSMPVMDNSDAQDDLPF